LLLLGTFSVIALLVFVSRVAAQDAGVQAVPIQDARSVGIGDYFFDPPDAAVEPGNTITWTNNGDEPHTVAFGGQGTVTSGPGLYVPALFSRRSFRVRILGS
jgi:plastocyanin